MLYVWHQKRRTPHLDREQRQFSGSTHNTAIKVRVVATCSARAVLLSDLATAEEHDVDSRVAWHEDLTSLTTRVTLIQKDLETFCPFTNMGRYRINRVVKSQRDP